MHFYHRPTSKILFATNHFLLFNIYHVHGMINRLLSAPYVCILLYNRNQRDRVQQTTLVTMYLTPAVHSPGTVLVPPAPRHSTGQAVGGWRGKDNLILIMLAN